MQYWGMTLNSDLLTVSHYKFNTDSKPAEIYINIYVSIKKKHKM